LKKKAGVINSSQGFLSFLRNNSSKNAPKKFHIVISSIVSRKEGKEGERNMGVRDPSNSSEGFKSRASKGREEICVCVSLASKVCCG
jgi:hypothetical protein